MLLLLLLAALQSAHPADPASPALQVRGQVTATVTASDDFYRHRAAFGVRYRPHLVGPFSAHLGGTLASDNALFPSRSGSDVRHWAVGLEWAVDPTVRLSAIHGRIIQDRSGEHPTPTCGKRYHHCPELQAITYYAFVAAGLEIRAGPGALTVEQLVWVPQQSGLGLNRTIVRARGRDLELSLTHTMNSEDQEAYAFWSFRGSLRLARALGAPRFTHPLLVEGGQRAVLGYAGNRDVPLQFLAVGAAFP